MRGKAGNVGSQALLHDVVPAPDVQPRQPSEEDRPEGVRGEAHGGPDQAAEHREKVSLLFCLLFQVVSYSIGCVFAGFRFILFRAIKISV